MKIEKPAKPSLVELRAVDGGPWVAVKLLEPKNAGAISRVAVISQKIDEAAEDGKLSRRVRVVFDSPQKAAQIFKFDLTNPDSLAEVRPEVLAKVNAYRTWEAENAEAFEQLRALKKKLGMKR